MQDHKPQSPETGAHQHRSRAAASVRAAVLTVSSTRNLDTDGSGAFLKERLLAAGHSVCDHRVVTDDAAKIADAVRSIISGTAPQVLLVNGGTGVTAKDVTIEAVRPLFSKELPAFGVLFAMQSQEEIGPAAILSRATAGKVGKTLVFCMPGSLAACRLALLTLILPDLPHFAVHVSE
ncbi:MAG: molybdenum cofactor biosynthesis protein B [Thermodesulfobacteriota bacterium]